MKNSNVMIRFVIVCLLLAMGVVSVRFSAFLFGAELNKIPTPLPHELKLVARDMGTNPKFSALGHDEIMSADMLERLGTNLYLIRAYTRMTTDGKPSDDLVNLNINYYQMGDATPHVPDICWAASGLTMETDELITVHDVPHKDGSISDVPMRLLSFMPAQKPGTGNSAGEQSTGDRLLTVGYTFQVNGEYVGNVAQVKKMFWRRDSKYGYHCKIELTYNPGKPCSRAKARPVIEAYLRAALPGIEECLPDWKKLNAPAGVNKATTAVSAVH